MGDSRRGARRWPPRDAALLPATVTLQVIVALVFIGAAWLVVPEQAAPDAGGAGASGDASQRATADPDVPAEWPQRHVVVEGDTLSEIAGRYGLDLAALARANALSASAVLHPGDVLLLPQPDRTRPQSPSTAVDEAPEVAALLRQTAAAFGLRASTVKAVAWEESRWDHAQVSDRAAVGIMQVRPATAEAMAHHLGRDLDLYALEDNVVLGVAYLDVLRDRYDGDLRRALIAYVQGPTRLDERGALPEAERYADRVLRVRDVFSAAG